MSDTYFFKVDDENGIDAYFMEIYLNISVIRVLM